MKINRKATGAVLLILLMGIGVTLMSCQKKEAGVTVSVQENDGPFVPYTEMVTILVPIIQQNGTNAPKGETLEDNFVTRFYTEKLNIKFKSAWTVDETSANEKLNAAVASNELPDMFNTNVETLGRLIKAGQVQPLDEVYEKYASPRLRDIVESQEGRGLLPGFVDNKHYALPIVADGFPVMMFFRKDWLDKLGLKVPATIDEMLIVARAFRDNDPDGNGINDTIAFALDRDFGQIRAGINALGNPLGAYTGIWIPDGSGGLVYGGIQPAIKELLTLMRQMYAEGLFDKEFAIKDVNKAAQDIAADKVGIYSGPFWAPLFPLMMSVQNNPSADWVVSPLMANKDGKRIVQTSIPISGLFVVRAGYPHPDALIKAMNLWAEMFHGEYAEDFNQLVATEKYIDIMGVWQNYNLPYFFQHPDKNIYLSDNVIEALKKNDESICFNQESRRTYEAIINGGLEGWGQNKVFGEGGTIQILKAYKDFVPDEFLGAPTTTMTLRTATLEKLENEAYFSVIMGEPVDTTFNKFVNDWKSQGGDQITKEVNDWYKSVRQ
ncbi:MAG: extracellular solute-binding protein [Treponema sp.]|jgi:putative aldouronate transport system substrate-binding protein|nr:extracellular solute-binding protein [Treponema sp.]